MNQNLLSTLARAHGVLRRRDHEALADATDAALTRGELVALFRGVYCAPSPDHATRLRALLLADPDAVATGPSAEHLHGWTSVAPESVTAASRLRPRPGFALERRVIPRRLTTRSGGVRFTTRALTAIDLATLRGVEEVDAALRRRIPLPRLWDAYQGTPNRRGRALVAQWLADSRSNPWSPLERVAHRALHDAGIRGWVANAAVALDGDIATAFPDIAFRSLRLAIVSRHPDNGRVDQCAVVRVGWGHGWTVRIERAPIELADAAAPRTPHLPRHTEVGGSSDRCRRVSIGGGRR